MPSSFVRNEVGSYGFHISIQAVQASKCTSMFLNHQNIELRGNTKRAFDALSPWHWMSLTLPRPTRKHLIVPHVLYSLTGSSHCRTVPVKTWALWCGDKLLLPTPRMEWGRIPNFLIISYTFMTRVGFIILHLSRPTNLGCEDFIPISLKYLLILVASSALIPSQLMVWGMMLVGYNKWRVA